MLLLLLLLDSGVDFEGVVFFIDFLCFTAQVLYSIELVTAFEIALITHFFLFRETKYTPLVTLPKNPPFSEKLGFNNCRDIDLRAFWFHIFPNLLGFLRLLELKVRLNENITSWAYPNHGLNQ